MGTILALLAGRWWLVAVAAAGLAAMLAGPLLEARGLRARVAEQAAVVDDLRALLEEQTRRTTANANALGEARRSVAEHVERERRAALSVRITADVERELRRELDRMREQLSKRTPSRAVPSAPCACDPVDDALDLLRARQQSTPDPAPGAGRRRDRAPAVQR